MELDSYNECNASCPWSLRLQKKSSTSRRQNRVCMGHQTSSNRSSSAISGGTFCMLRVHFLGGMFGHFSVLSVPGCRYDALQKWLLRIDKFICSKSFVFFGGYFEVNGPHAYRCVARLQRHTNRREDCSYILRTLVPLVDQFSLREFLFEGM